MLVSYCLLIFGNFFVFMSFVDCAEETLAKIEELIKQWAPLIWLAPKETFLPLGVEEFLDHVDLSFKGNNTKRLQINHLPFGNNSRFFNFATKQNLDSLLKDKQSFLYGKDPSKNKVPIYAVVTQCAPGLSYRVTDGTFSEVYNSKDNYPSFHVTFWTFYPYNEGKDMCLLGNLPTPMIFGACIGERRKIGNHVGDWEHISLSFSGKRHPDKLYVSVHDAGVYYNYDTRSHLFKYDRQVTRKGIMQRPQFPPIVKQRNSHPILFSARGSHGLWSAPGEHYYVRVPKLIDKNGYGISWETWKNIEMIHLKSQNIPFWTSFKGNWGNLRKNCFLMKNLGICELSDGPKGILERKKDFYC